MFWKFLRNDMLGLEKMLRVVGPLDCNKIKQRQQKVFVALGNIETGQADYICLNDENDIIKALLATCAMPFYALPSELHGKLYYDAGLVSQPIDKAISLADNPEIWIIMMDREGYRPSWLYWKVFSWLALFNSKARNLINKYLSIRNDFLDKVEQNQNLKIIRPKHTLPIGYRSRNKKLTKVCFELGRVQVKEFLAKYYEKPD